MMAALLAWLLTWGVRAVLFIVATGALWSSVMTLSDRRR
jgi:hypothetical protein